jgi:hypothetical protein
VNEKGRQEKKAEISAKLVKRKRIVVVTRRDIVTFIDDVLLYIFPLCSFLLKIEKDFRRSCTQMPLRPYIRADYNFAVNFKGHGIEREKKIEIKQSEEMRRKSRFLYSND